MKKICFKINGKNLYLEAILIELDHIPLFFVCSDTESLLYVVLCVDFDNFEYIIVQSKAENILQMLNGKMEMRKIFEKQNSFWQVLSHDLIDEDEVLLKDISDLPSEVLPLKGAYYEILSDRVKKYVSKLENQLLDESMYSVVSTESINACYIEPELDFNFNVEYLSLTIKPKDSYQMIERDKFVRSFDSVLNEFKEIKESGFDNIFPNLAHRIGPLLRVKRPEAAC